MSDEVGRRQSKTRGAYGARLADCFGLPEPPSYVQRTLRRGITAVSELRIDNPTSELTGSLGYDDAFLLTLHLEPLVAHELWVDGRLVSKQPYKAGATYIHDLRRDPRGRVLEPTHTLHFYLPLTTLNAFAEQHDCPVISDLIYKPGVGQDDPVVRHLGESVRAALRDPHATSGLLLDQVLNAVCAHVLGEYGAARTTIRRQAGTLAHWQERRAKTMMDDRMDVSLSELATECRVSVAHFVRAFRRSTGYSPHQWLLARRVCKAMDLLGSSKMTLSEIALACGFSSQSHFNRTFTASVGLSPGRWRHSREPTSEE